jgi:hypothetical protein
MLDARFLIITTIGGNFLPGGRERPFLRFELVVPCALFECRFGFFEVSRVVPVWVNKMLSFQMA